MIYAGSNIAGRTRGRQQPQPLAHRETAQHKNQGKL